MIQFATHTHTHTTPPIVAAAAAATAQKRSCCCSRVLFDVVAGVSLQSFQIVRVLLARCSLANGGHSSFFSLTPLMISQSFLATVPFLMKTFRPSIHPFATHKGQYLRGLLNGMIIRSPPRGV